MVILDFLLFIMISICIIYCWMLTRKIQDLQNSRIEFARMIKELNSSIIKAENNVNELSQLSKITGSEIKFSIDQANKMIENLSKIILNSNEASEKLKSQLEKAENLPIDINYNLSSKNGEKFSEEDLAPKYEIEDSYSDKMKEFMQNIISSKKLKKDTSSSLDQSSYYDTLRKINAKK